MTLFLPQGSVVNSYFERYLLDSKDQDLLLC